MHLFGSAIFFGCVGGPSYMLAAPILGIFGWFFIFPEAIGFWLIWKLYKPHPKQGWTRIIRFGLIFGIVGALAAAPLIPKEENHELIYWIAGLLAGLGAAIFSFSCTHKIKMADIDRAESGKSEWVRQN